jgi:hypothetical protein
MPLFLTIEIQYDLGQQLRRPNDGLALAGLVSPADSGGDLER